jgi:hypothetical protein
VGASKVPYAAKKKKRAPRPKRVEPDLTPADMAHAARDLHRQLSWIVERLDDGYREPSDDARNWAKLSFKERASTRSRHSKRPSLVEAVAIFAERRVIDVRRESLGLFVGHIALALARGKTDAKRALDDVRRRRRDGSLDADGTHAELRAAVNRARTEPAKWQAAYRVLAADADIWPLPDTRSGLRDGLRRLYEAIKKPPQAVPAAQVEGKRREAITRAEKRDRQSKP